MNLEDIERLRSPLQALIDSGSRTNANKTERYWYPLSIATYDVEEVLAAVDSLCSFRTTMWEKTKEFEREFARMQGAKHAVMVNSGSSADLLIAFALVNPTTNLLRPGDEVLVPSVTWPTQLWSLMMAGLRVRLVDTNPRTLNMDLGSVEARITDRTRAVSLVHLMGNPCEMDELLNVCESHDLMIIEDCCEALGSTYNGRMVGTFGLASSFSFFFSHHITTMEGGMICCDDDEFAELLRLLRAHGWSRNLEGTSSSTITGIDPRYTFLNWGFNVRPTELQAGFGLVQLGRLPGFSARRQSNAKRFAEGIARHDGVLRLMEVSERAECSWFALPLMVSPDAPFTRDDLARYLEGSGVETRPIVAGSLSRHPASALFSELSGQVLPGADVVHNNGLYLGLHPVDEPDKLDRLLELIDGYVEGRS